jgi:hypothetical protein
MDALLNYIQLKAFGRGMRGYHTAWFVIGVAIWMLNRARRQQDVVYRTELKPGERLLVRSSKPPSAKSSGR